MYLIVETKRGEGERQLSPLAALRDTETLDRTASLQAKWLQLQHPDLRYGTTPRNPRAAPKLHNGHKGGTKYCIVPSGLNAPCSSPSPFPAESRWDPAVRPEPSALPGRDRHQTPQ